MKKRIKRIELFLILAISIGIINLAWNIIQHNNLTWLEGMYDNAIEVLILGK